MRSFVSILGVLAAATSYAAIDITPYAILNPSDSSYVQADSGIVPKLGITNLGDQAADNFWVKFIAVEAETGDTTTVDSALVGHIAAYPDSIEVELPAWTPDCICRRLKDGGPFLEYTLTGISLLELDENLANDTVRQSVTSLWPHDAGVTDVILDPPPEGQNNHYDVGDTFVATVRVENFGFHTEYDVPVRFEDMGVIMFEVYVNIDTFAWRGDSLGNPYSVELVFPEWVVMLDSADTYEWRTEMVADRCSDDDKIDVFVNTAIEETPPEPLPALQLTPSGSSVEIAYSLPSASNVSIKIYDACGKRVATVIEGISQAGANTVTWNCSAVPAGVYMIRMEAADFSTTRKIVIR